MKRSQFLALACLFSLLHYIHAEDSKDVWIFPSSGYFLYLSDFNEQFLQGERTLINDYEPQWSLSTGNAPAMVANGRHIYFRDSYDVTRVDRSMMRLEADGYQSYRDGDSRWLSIMGGGFFATNRLPSHDPEAFVSIFKHLSDTRRFLLADQPDRVFTEFFDRVYILPQTIKSVSMSAPFLEETVRGVRYRYDDDFLLYRWFYYFLNRGDMAMYFVDDPTPMVEGAPGNGTGLRLDISYHLPVDNLVVLNGFVDMERRHLYKQNARIKRVLVQGDGFEFEYDFDDRVYFAQIDFPNKVERVELTVLEVYDGDRFEDLCISGLFTNPDILKTRNKPFVLAFLEKVKSKWAESH